MQKSAIDSSAVICESTFRLVVCSSESLVVTIENGFKLIEKSIDI
jgi:hypothetical protein